VFIIATLLIFFQKNPSLSQSAKTSQFRPQCFATQWNSAFLAWDSSSMKLSGDSSWYLGLKAPTIRRSGTPRKDWPRRSNSWYVQMQSGRQRKVKMNSQMIT